MTNTDDWKPRPPTGDSTTVYTASDGKLHDVKLMPYPYLVSALAVLRRKHPHRTAEIEAMAAEVAKRDAEYEARDDVLVPGDFAAHDVIKPNDP
jgi:hypothetical protein